MGSYAKYRPNYPAGVVKTLKSDCGLTESSIVADIGSGTGILTEALLKNGNQVFGVEPNAAMRKTAEAFLKDYEKFVSIEGSAEATNLEAKSVDFVTAAQAFHWFDREKTKEEFQRILKDTGWVVLIWNERRLDSTWFLREYEALLLRYGTDYQEVRQENVTGKIGEFFAPNSYALKTLDNHQHFDLEAFKGRVASASYTPEPGHPAYEAMVSDLETLFRRHNADGIVTFEYDTRVYYGRLALPALTGP